MQVLPQGLDLTLEIEEPQQVGHARGRRDYLKCTQGTPNMRMGQRQWEPVQGFLPLSWPCYHQQEALGKHPREGQNWPCSLPLYPSPFTHANTSSCGLA